MEKCDALQQLGELIKHGIITPKEVINIIETKVKEGKAEPALLTYAVKYLTLLNKLHNNEYIRLEEMVEVGLFDSMDQIHEIIDNNPDDFKDCVMYKIKPCCYPEPTTEEISQNLPYDEDKSCIICFTRKKNTVFIPCGHTLCCTVCSKTICEKAKEDEKYVECSICKKQVDTINKIYL